LFFGIDVLHNKRKLFFFRRSGVVFCLLSAMIIKKNNVAVFGFWCLCF